MDIDWDGDLGILLRRDALAQGYDDRTLRMLVRRGELHRIRRGAFIPTSTWNLFDAAGRHRATARAVLRTAHPSAVLTHVSSVLEHDAPTWSVDLSEVHLTRTDGLAGRREAGVVHHRGALPVAEVLTRHSIPLSPAGRACIELTTMASVESSLVSTNWLLAQGATTNEELATLVERFRFWPRSLRSDLVVRLADPRCAWPGEARLSHLMWREHLPKPAPQHEVYDEAGNLVAALDFALPDFGVFIEFDGLIKYQRLRREDETFDDVVLREKRREELVCLLTGWICIRITWEDLARPALTARRIRAVLAGRAASRR
ncbi:MAG: hypothetical protein QOH37_323 [Nocardioidaceae bacterium]|jgi:hypothetical protein|nr:hypothetical protein [Nocardioidaceae bacterium]